MANPEAKFQKKVLRELRQYKGLWVFTKEAASIRGLPDIIGCYMGKFFGWELKVSAAEARKGTGRIVLQSYTLDKINQAGGIGRIVYPEILQDCIVELLDSVE